ncbi:MAG: Hint domain-containing protein [Rhodobacteraceae bacterium]|nr:Hint domain-containing protein [Paracoccaceae bacterium]
MPGEVSEPLFPSEDRSWHHTPDKLGSQIASIFPLFYQERVNTRAIRFLGDGLVSPIISEMKYLGSGTLDFVEVRIPDSYPDPQNLVLVIYDRTHDGSTTATPSAGDMYAIEGDGDTSDDTVSDGFTHYIVGSAYDGTAIRLHAQDAVGLYNSATGETYGVYSFGSSYTVSTAALQPDGITPDPFAGQATTVLPASSAVGDSIVANGDGTYSGTSTPTPGSSFLCFCDGTQILTDRGLKPVEDLIVGDLVACKDKGYKPIRWIGSRWFDPAEGPDSQSMPIKISKGALGSNLPSEDLFVSPNHCLLVEHHLCDFFFGEQQVLIPAKHLVGMIGVSVAHRSDFGYFHVLLDDHEMIWANGTWAESLYFGDTAFTTMGWEKRQELITIFPGLKSTKADLRSYAPIAQKFEIELLVSNWMSERSSAH